MKDRTPRYPGRVKMVPVSGQANTYDMVRADDPVEEGTPINKKTLLTDETAYLLELKKENPTPDDAFSHIARNFTGDGGMNINLLEEAIHMKYCKVLTHENARSAIADFYANTILQTGYESDDGTIQALAAIERTVSSQIKIRIINKATGKEINSVIPLTADVYKQNMTGNTGPGTGVVANFNGWFHFCPVRNKPNEIMLKINGTLDRSTYVASGTSGTAYYYQHTMRMVHIMDVTTGEVKAHVLAYNTNTDTSYNMANFHSFGMGSNDYCYYNSTYDFYYTPLTSRLSGDYSSSGMLFYVKPGVSFETSSYASFSSTGQYGFASGMCYNSYWGTSYYSSDYSGRGFSWYVPITDSVGISFMYDSYSNGYMYVYSVSQTGYSTFSKTTLYSSSSFYAFANDGWSYSPASDNGMHTHILFSNNKLYMFANGNQHTSHAGYDANEASCLMRFGPFSLTTSSSNPPVATLVKGIPSASRYTSNYRIFNMIGCKNGNPDEPIFAMLPYDSNVRGGYGGTVTSLAMDTQQCAYRLMMPSIMGGATCLGTKDGYAYYRYDGVNNPWARGWTLPTCWYNNHLTKMFMCDMERNIYLGDFVDQIYKDEDGVWTCPEDGTYKIIMVGGGAAGGSTFGGGSGYMKIVTRVCIAGEQIPYHIGWGGINDNDTSNPYAAEPGSPMTWFGDKDTFANGGACGRGGANGYPSSAGGGGGGYDLVNYGGNGQTISNPPQRNGGQGAMPAIGYGAGGSAGSNGNDGVIVIVR